MSHILILGPDLTNDGTVLRISWLDEARAAIRAMLVEIGACAADAWQWTTPYPGEPALMVDGELPDGTIIQHVCIDEGHVDAFVRVKATSIAPGGRRTVVQIATDRNLAVRPIENEPTAVSRLLELALEALDTDVSDRLDPVMGARWNLCALTGSDALLAEGRPGASRARDRVMIEVCGSTPLSPGFLTLRAADRRPMTSRTEVLESTYDGAPADGAVGVSVSVVGTSIEIGMQPAVMNVAVPAPVERLRREAELRRILGDLA